LELVNLYKCLSDKQRMRIINLLNEGPLCVCHIQEILGETQVKISKQLQYMKKLGVVLARREGVWMIYSLSEPTHPVLVANMLSIHDQDVCFAEDLKSRYEIIQGYTSKFSECPLVV